MIKKISVLCLLPTFVFATNPCEYDNQTTSTMQGTVESVIVKDKTVTEYFRETKKCKVLIKAKILGKWYMTSQDYIFTPDMSCLLYTSPSPRDVEESRMPSSA